MFGLTSVIKGDTPGYVLVLQQGLKDCVQTTVALSLSCRCLPLLLNHCNMYVVHGHSISYYVSSCSNTLRSPLALYACHLESHGHECLSCWVKTDTVVCLWSTQVCLWTVESTLASLFIENNGSRLVWREALLGD